MRNLFILGCVAAAFVLPNVVGRCQADGCAPLSAETRGKIATYAAERYELAPDVRIEDGGVVASSCFRHLTVQSTTPRRSIELFLSPDQRFLSESLFDSWLDPALERRRAGQAAQAALLAGRSPSAGSEGAAVTLVEFSDFQCPFCKRAAKALHAMPDDLRGSVRIVFRHRPLSMHPRARRAALVSICASFQGDEAFWAVEGFLFDRQDSIKPETLEAAIRDFASGETRLSVGRWEACLAANDAEEVLLRDERLADMYHIDAVPTVFVNGVRRAGFGTEEALWSALRVAVFEARGSGGGGTPNRP
ncbi:MAG: DsbA family protein [Bryobacteraceae bacterium]